MPALSLVSYGMPMR